MLPLSEVYLAFDLIAALTSVPNASEGYIYGYAPVSVGRMRNQQLCDFGPATNTLTSTGELMTPFTSPIVAPNVDTLYGVVWVDLREGPVIIGIPNMEAAPRYHVFQAMDFYTYVWAYDCLCFP